jgi:hypothetical protein
MHIMKVLVWVQFGYISAVHALRIICNIFFFTDPHDFDKDSCWYYHVKNLKV